MKTYMCPFLGKAKSRSISQLNKNGNSTRNTKQNRKTKINNSSPNKQTSHSNKLLPQRKIPRHPLLNRVLSREIKPRINLSRLLWTWDLAGQMHSRHCMPLVGTLRWLHLYWPSRNMGSENHGILISQKNLHNFYIFYGSVKSRTVCLLR
jgi:hypothetical protein